MNDKDLPYLISLVENFSKKKFLMGSYQNISSNEKENLKKIFRDNNIFFLVGDEIPIKLKEISPIPAVIFYQGNIDLIYQPTLGIVGPRIPSPYGIQIIEYLCEQLKKYTVVTVSGGAKGIDSEAHRHSIEKKIPTIVVLGGGMLSSSVKKKKKFLDEVVYHGGCILSEFPVFFEATEYTFPLRNRIIAQLSDIIFLPEAGHKSGSLITVDFAQTISKPVYGTPNNIFSEHSRGLHQAMEEGKVFPVADISQRLQKSFGKKTTVHTEKKEFSLIHHNVLKKIDESGEIDLIGLTKKMKIQNDEIMIILCELELAGMIEKTLWGYRCK